MAVRIKSITFDCADPYRLAQFWLQLTGFSEDPDNGNAPDDPEALLLSPDGSLALLFIAVPEPKHVKNRVHLDLVPLTSRRDEEVDQLLRIGARLVDDQRRPDGGGWVVLSDPEGNEFCIERSDAERAPLVDQLGRAFDAVAGLISNIRAGPVVSADPMHGLDGTPDGQSPDRHEPGLRRAARRPAASAQAVRGPCRRRPGRRLPRLRSRAAAAFGRPGVLERTYHGPLGTATGAERLQIRLYDLLAHGWDLAQATEQPADLPDDLAEQSLAFARTQLTEQARPGRFGPAQIVAEQAPAIERLVAFLGRPVNTGR